MLQVIDIWAPWCGPCKQMMPLIEDLATEYNVPDSQVQIQKVNADEDPVFVEKHGVKAIPTLLFIKNGEVVDKLIGSKSRADIVKTIEAHLIEDSSN